MHGSAGLHSAMAIKRQRRIREQAKRRGIERDRRLSSRTSSIGSMDNVEHFTVRNNPQAPPDHRLATSIGMLHLGVCFLVLGIFLMGSGLLPDDVVSWRGGGWWNELLATGIFVSAVGIFLIVLNRVMAKKEEHELNEYVQTQLTRSRSGHRLELDVETGCLTTRNHRICLEKKREKQNRDRDENSTNKSPISEVTPITTFQNGDAYPEKILEENEIPAKNNQAFETTILSTSNSFNSRLQ